jgi:phospholipase C
MPKSPRPSYDRRTFLKAGLGAAALGAAAGTGLSWPAGASIERAASLDVTNNPTLGDIEHIVILMQENRSFDHYFGTLSGVRGFSDPDVRVNDIFGTAAPVWNQYGFSPQAGLNSGQYLQPFPLQNITGKENGSTTNDISHEWWTQHQSWNNGKMDSFVQAHLNNDGPHHFLSTMGYFTRDDLSFYYALADAFTICDAYHCSVIGPTDPNRVAAFSGTINPTGEGGGPVLITQVAGRPGQYGKFTWETMPERLLDAGVSWKVYNDALGLALFSPLPYFKAYTEATTTRGQALIERAIAPNYPANFLADVAAGTLPQVSWIHGPPLQCEHPAFAPQWGESAVQTVLDILTSNPDVWAKTLFILHYDENGGFFDHVQPPTPPPGTEGEYLSLPLPGDAHGIDGPVGLGFRVPCLLMSPFTRGGLVSGEVLDHSSTLRLIETKFGVEVPNVSAWRRNTVGDMTASLSLGSPSNPSVPALPQAVLPPTNIDEQQILFALEGFADVGPNYPPPTSNQMPVQETTPLRPRIA